MKSFGKSASGASLPRRRFVQGLALGGSLAGLGLMRPATSGTASGMSALRTLSGTEFALDIIEAPVNFTGTSRIATTIDGGIPGPLLRWKEGTHVRLRVTNRLRVPGSIHWHGILLPTGMDGVPGMSFDGIAPGETFVYHFPVRQSGTYWYHSHSRFQEQTGVYGPLVIEPRDGERHAADREHVVMLNDWTDEDPEAVFANLKKMGDYYNFGQPTVRDFAADAARMGVADAIASRRMWNHMRMSPRDLVDVTGYTYTYLINGMAPAGNWTGLFKPGERVRLRFINGSANSFFDVRIPGLEFTVIACDGQDIEPVTVDEFRIAVAETCDVMVQPRDDRAYTIFAQSMSRDGYARATLAPRSGMHAEVPDLDPLPALAMVDMMGAAHGSHAESAMKGSPAHDMHHKGMHHDGMGMQRAGTTKHAGMGMPGKVHHAKTEYGPGVDMRVDTPRTNLDDPGIGLRDNGRRVLTYADLHTIGGSLYGTPPTREIELHLTGNMERFMWSFDGQKFSDAKPIHVAYGERVRIVLVNDTMMTHPIHLHGMWSELESPDGRFQVRKHTIAVQPAQRVSYLVTGDVPGRWAYHCHLLYHMEAGMFREVLVS